MAVQPYYVRLRGTGLKKKGERDIDWDKGREFAFVDFKKGGEVLVGTKQGAVMMRVFVDGIGNVRARVTTNRWQYPPHSENWHGVKKFVTEFKVRDPDEKMKAIEQLKMWGVGVTQCSGCHAEIVFIETVNGVNQPFDVKPIKVTILNSEGKAEVIDSFMPHHATCPNRDEFRK
jgi:hypothetical protein